VGTDVSTFSSFVSGSQAQFLRLAFSLTGDRAAAEDLVQTALMRTYSHWARIGGQDPVAYCRRVIVNANHDRWRTRPGREVAQEAEPRPVSDHAPVLAERNAIVRALRELTDRERVVVVMRFLVDLSEADTARELGLRPGTVKSTTSRGHGQAPGQPPPDRDTTGDAMNDHASWEGRVRELLGATDPGAGELDLDAIVRGGTRQRRLRQLGAVGGATLLTASVVIAFGLVRGGTAPVPAVTGPTASTPTPTASALTTTATAAAR
jgi:RNA polymerase sigma-70 factor (sigma-E family)